MEIYGFGKIVGATEEEDFTDYITEILVKYNKKKKKTRRGVLRLAKQVVEEAKERKEKENKEK